MVKRLLDILLSSIGLIIASPLMLFIAIAICIDSKGPALFRQERVGRYNKNFKLYKFRSMIHQNERQNKFDSRGDGSPHITKVGRLIRRCKLDELPQLINVFIGDMSFVGPRPWMRHVVDYYPVKEFEQILSVRPGITSPASVLYANEGELLARQDDPDHYFYEVLTPHKIEMNKQYVASHTLWGDMKILLKTFLP